MIGGLAYDHTATVWRSTESRSAGLRDVTRSWAKVAAATGIRIGVQVLRERRDDTGGGERTTGEYSGYGPAALDLEEGDVVQLTAGPEAPATLEVDRACRPQNRHLELTLIAWPGELPS